METDEYLPPDELDRRDREDRLMQVWDADVQMTDEEARDALIRVGRALAAKGGVADLDEDVVSDQIRLCQYFRSKTVSASRLFGRELLEALKTLAPWTARNYLTHATLWRVKKAVPENRARDFKTWGERLEQFAALLTTERTDAQRALLNDMLRLPAHDDLPDSCADEPIASDELVVRLHGALANQLADQFTLSAYVLGAISACGALITVGGFFSEGSFPLVGVVAGLTILSIASATFVRRLTSLRLSLRTLAASRTVSGAITAAATLQTVIIGFWTLGDDERPVLVPMIIAVGITLVTSVTANFCSELASLRIAELNSASTDNALNAGASGVADERRDSSSAPL